MTNNIISLKPFIDRMADEERNRDAYFDEMEQLRQTELEQEEIWRQQRAIHGFPGEDDIPVEDGYRYFDPDDPDHIMAAFDRLIEQQKAEDIEAAEALAIIKGLLDRFVPPEEAAAEPELEIRDPHPDEPLTLFEVVCLPELGGQLYVGKNVPGKVGPNITVKTLRNAISRGQLAVFRPNEKNLYVTRLMIKEWLHLCQEKSKNPVSLNESPVTTKRASSLTKAPGSSSTTENRLRQDALSLLTKNLR
ncbi:hypothetical protein ASD54_07455 [Rhizobium sp. Root149]|uniref:hypothetical protein n=1 Tax=Rhizobium sp. Root149 TaxID=1736473 RepID=UPI0007148807|nr:hypothetical protein [Rhizobium sp. Root149]KQZ55106.1 hypothetical protein ASD54_07455 [Rhizobium sp. Root149]